jgi:hypothetical protein
MKKHDGNYDRKNLIIGILSIMIVLEYLHWV